MGGNIDTGRVKSLETQFAIIDALRERRTAGVRELADHLGMSKSTVHRYLATLEGNEFAVKEDGRYRLSFRFLEIGGSLRDEMVVFKQQIKPHIDFIAEETGELAGFMFEEHGKVVLVYRAEGVNAVATEGYLGKRFGLHHSAGGKVILAQLPEGRVDEIIDKRRLPKKTEQTITDREELLEHLAEIRDRGFAVDREETTEGLWAIGAPLLGGDEQVIGAFNITGPARRMADEEQQQAYVDLLLGITNEIQLNIKHDPAYE